MHNQLSRLGQADLIALVATSMHATIQTLLVVTSIPMSVFLSFLKLRDNDRKLYTDPDFFIYVCKKVAEEVMKSATMRIFKKEEDGRFTEVDKIVDEPVEETAE